jgi:excisionase family DNA binding protein
MTGPSRPFAGAEPISVKVPEAVRLTGISRSRLYELMRSGDVAFAKVGSSTLILVDSLRAYVESRRSPPDRLRLMKEAQTWPPVPSKADRTVSVR